MKLPINNKVKGITFNGKQVKEVWVEYTTLNKKQIIWKENKENSKEPI